MDVDIGEILSKVQAVDDRALLSPRVVQLLVEAVLVAVDEQTAHSQRVASEQRIGSGVAAELRGGD
ncbi:MAG: hypothetical protein P8103_08300 [Candidatus Thiodiazotropha sp.]